MHDHELAMIAELAAGQLSPDEAARAEELLARGGEYRAEYEAQLRALGATAAASSARLTDLERAHLHRTVMDRITTAPSGPRSAPRTLRWLRPLAAAAVAVVIVGFGTWFVSGNQTADLATDTIESLESAPADTAVTRSGADEQQFAAETETVGQAPTGDPTPTNDDSAAGEISAAAAAPLDLGSVSSREIDDQYLTGLYLGGAQYTVDAPASIETVQLTCAAAAADLSGEEGLLAFGTATYDGKPAQFFGFESRRLLFLSADGCSLLGEHP